MLIKTKGVIFDANEVVAIRKGENGIYIHFKCGYTNYSSCDSEEEVREQFECIWNQIDLVRKNKSGNGISFDVSNGNRNKIDFCKYWKSNKSDQRESEVKIDGEVIAKRLCEIRGGDIG